MEGIDRVELLQVEVRTRTRVRVSLSAGTAAESHAAWAGIVSLDHSGGVSHAAYLSTQVNRSSTADTSQGTSTGNFSTSTVWLGHPAAWQAKQAQWYYVSSVITGTVDLDGQPAATAQSPGAAESPATVESPGASVLARLCLFNLSPRRLNFCMNFQQCKVVLQKAQVLIRLGC